MSTGKGGGSVPLSAPHQPSQQNPSLHISLSVYMGWGRGVSGGRSLGYLEDQGNSRANKANPVGVWNAGHLSFGLPGTQEMWKGLKSHTMKRVSGCLHQGGQQFYPWKHPETPRLNGLKQYVLGFPGGAVVEDLPANAGDTGSSPGLGRSHMPQSN